MISKKYVILFVVAVASVSSVYGLHEKIQYETTPTLFVVAGHSQYGEYTFEELVELHELTIMGKITNLGVRVMPEVIETYTDENGVEQIEKTSKPEREITLEVIEILNDKVGVESNKVIFYDRVDKALGKKNGQTTEFSTMYATDYQIGDVGIWTLQYEDDVFKGDGYATYYPIRDGETTMMTELDRLTNDNPINIEQAKRIAKMLATLN